ncbi:VCBS domain-containing protein [Shewanella avicenniae]|uniref:VCBS domain-containing protein n=1 Tax=Shewanella avicenniae TaxID=2814294 RepID=A0ABX7QNR6_9GAMM|nr:VCBS domain-containing protein [Shewanella avicenniae]QSX32635.1 VCBS domain-containing protein [Shewanella avicenniae]
MTQPLFPQEFSSETELMKLEQRFMFDGAAVATSADVMSDADTSSHDIDLSVQDMDSSFFEPAVAHESTNQATELASEQIRTFLETASVEQLFSIFNGGKEQIDMAWLQSLEAVRQGIFSNEINVKVELLDNQTFGGSLGAFSANGTNGQPTIYLNESYLLQFGADVASRVLVEEFGHALDSLINNGDDTAGDEGQHFADVVFGTNNTVSDGQAASDDDHGVLTVNGENIDVEWARYDFVNAYAMLRDINGDGIANNTENWAEKEQSSHTIIISDETYANGLGPVTVDDSNYNSHYFSGNDVSAIGINIGGTDYYGWISRPLKVQGEVKAFYFWTDTDFVDFETAQADGNQDGDSDSSDNLGFILVVDQAYFDGLTKTDLTVATGAEAGIYSVVDVKSSSDRVDSALNELVDKQTANIVPTANDDNNSMAVELGTDLDDTPVRVITPTVNATGNVLTNDTDGNNDSLIVTDVSVAGRGGSTIVGSNGTTVIIGQFGTLNINQDGYYTYVVENSNSSVDALLTGTATDTFTYTVADGKGGFATARLTINIQGSNDAPVSNDDFNSAKESTTTVGSGFDYSGYNATGNVLNNDNDVDSHDVLSIDGLSSQGTAAVGVVTVNTGSYQLTFSSANGQSLANKVTNGDELYVDLTDVGGNVSYNALYYSADNGGTFTQVYATSSPVTIVNGYSIPLSHIPNYYWDGSGYVAINDPVSFLETHQYVSFEDSTKSIENSSQGAQAMLQSSATTGGTVLTELSNLTGTIGIGMTVIAEGVPTGTTVTDVTYSSGLVSSITLSSDQITSVNGTTFTFSGGEGTPDVLYQGAHGQLFLSADGSYTYTPNADNSAIAEGEVVQDIFTYTMRDSAGETSQAELIINVYGAGVNDSTGVTDTIVAVEQGDNLNTNTVLVNGVNPSGNILTNDTGPSTAQEFVVSISTEGSSSAIGSSAIDQTVCSCPH